MLKTLANMESSEYGIIAALEGGIGMQERLRLLGLAEGRKIRKISSLAWGGPVIVEVNRAQVAVGSGMARRILVRVTARSGGRVHHEESRRG